MNDTIRTSLITIAVGLGIAAAVLARGIGPELVRYFRIRRM